MPDLVCRPLITGAHYRPDDIVACAPVTVWTMECACDLTVVGPWPLLIQTADQHASQKRSALTPLDRLLHDVMMLCPNCGDRPGQAYGVQCRACEHRGEPVKVAPLVEVPC